jgi:polyketide synthase PksN
MALPTRRNSVSLELHDIVWGRPLIAAKDQQVNVALFARNEAQIDFEIYSAVQGPDGLMEEVVHCQGHAALRAERLHATLDTERLKTRMRQGRVVTDAPGIDSIYRGEGQLLAELHLRAAAEPGGSECQLHPGLLDAALQAAVGLVADSARRPRHLSLPYALESIRLESPLVPSMFAWIRHSRDSRKDERLLKLDIDLCDRRGDVCIKLRGVTYELVALSAATQPSAAPQSGKPPSISLAAADERIFDVTSRKTPVVTLDSAGAS